MSRVGDNVNQVQKRSNEKKQSEPKTSAFTPKKKSTDISVDTEFQEVEVEEGIKFRLRHYSARTPTKACKDTVSGLNGEKLNEVYRAESNSLKKFLSGTGVSPSKQSVTTAPIDNIAKSTSATSKPTVHSEISVNANTDALESTTVFDAAESTLHKEQGSACGDNIKVNSYNAEPGVKATSRVADSHIKQVVTTTTFSCSSDAEGESESKKTYTTKTFEDSAPHNPSFKSATMENTDANTQKVETNVSGSIPTPTHVNIPSVDYDLTKQDLRNLEAKRDSLAPESMERMLLDMRIDMKKDTLKLMSKIDNVASLTSTLQQDVTMLKTANKDFDTRLQTTENLQVSERDRVNGALTSIEELNDQVRILQGIVQKQGQQHHLNRSQTENKLWYEMRNNLPISGLDKDGEEAETPTSTAEMVTDFFSQTMKLPHPVAITRAIRIGKGKPRTVLVTLKDGRDKRGIFECAKNLKGVKNNNDEEYSVNSQFPASMQENKKCARIIMKINNSMAGVGKRNLTIKKGELFVDWRPFVNPIQMPAPHEVIYPLDKKHVDKIKLNKGEIQKRGRCSFVGYSAEVSSIADVRAAYTKVARLNASALHISVGYRLPGVDFVHLRGYEDNNEYGAGRVIFQMLENYDIYHRAIFVVRYYGNHHVGPIRFQLITAAGKSAITRSSYNSILKIHQVPWNETSNKKLTQGYAKAASPMPYNAKPSWGSTESLEAIKYNNAQPHFQMELRPRANSIDSTASFLSVGSKT